MTDKNKDSQSSDGKVSVSIRLPAKLVEIVDEEADKELRSRSAQIQKILEENTTKAPVTGKR